MKTIFLSFAVLLSGQLIFAQTIIEGIVVDQNGSGLVGANIYLSGTYDGTTTNEKGAYKLSSRESGDHILCIDFVGFRSHKEKITLDGTSLNIPTIQLVEVFNELTAATITAGTFEAGDKKKSIALSPIDMVTTAGAAGDVFGALRALPGTTTVGESGRLFVKGGDSRESKTYIDGTLVYVPYSSSSPNNAVRGRFSPFMFSGTMFSTGGYSAEYGQALSSVLALQTNAMPAQDQLDISLLSVGAELGGTKRWENASITTSINYDNLLPYMKLVPQTRIWLKEPQSLTGSASFRLKTGKSGMLKVYANANQTELSTSETDLQNPSANIAYHLLNENYFINASWNGEVAKDWILSTGFSFTRNSDLVRADSLKFNEYLSGSHAKIVIRHRMSEFTRIIAGAELYSKKFGVDLPNEEIQESMHFLNHTLTGFAEGEIYGGPNFVTRIGTRFEYSDYLQKASIAPRVSSAYKLNEKSQFSLSYGWFFQDPDDEFMLYTNAFNFERADHYTLNYIFKSEKRILRTELYYKKYHNLVKYELNGPYNYQSFNNNGDGYAYGLDFFWRDSKSIKNADYWISYSLIEAKRNYLDYPSLSVPPFASKHNLTLVYKHWVNRLRSRIGGTYRLNSPRYYNNPNVEQFNGEKTIPYQSLDLNWSYLHRQHVIFYFSVTNVLGFEQEFGREYARSPDSKGYYNSTAKLPGAKRFIILGCFITLSKSGDLNQLDKIN